MLDLQTKSAFERRRAAGTGSGVIATERLHLGIATVMQRKDKWPEFAAAVKRRFGFDPPDEPRWVSAQGMAMLGIGRGKWLAIQEQDEDGSFFAQLTAELEGLASVVEQSNALGVLRLSGPMLYPTMEKGVQLDLGLQTFPVGSLAVTSIAHIGVTVWKVDEAPTIEVAVARSLADSFLHWLESSAAMYGLETFSPMIR